MCINILYILLFFITTANFFAVNGQSDEHKEYQSEGKHFSAKYQNNWRVLTPKDYSPGNGGTGNYEVVVFVSPVIKTGDQKNSAGIIICSQPTNNQLNDFAKTYCGRQDDHLSDNAKDEVIARKQIKVDGVDAERIETKKRLQDRYIYYVSFSTKSRKFFITGVFRKSTIEELNTFKYEPEFDNIIESIKLIDGESKK